MTKKKERAPRPQKKPRKADNRESIIVGLLREFPNNKFSVKHLASSSGGNTRPGRHETLEILQRLIEEGVADRCDREKYRLSSRMRPRLEGLVEMLPSGAMHVKTENPEKPQKTGASQKPGKAGKTELSESAEQEVFVSQCNSMNALDGDRVEFVILHTSKSGVQEGQIVAIKERSMRCYVGTAEADAYTLFVRVDSRRIPVDIYLHRKLYPDVKTGDKLVVRIQEWPEESKCPVGELVENLGPAGDNDTEMHAILAEYDLPYRFEKEVEQAAEAIPSLITEKDCAERRDFRPVTTFTIDPADAKDFDDALSIRKIRDGVWEIGVHIADVTHYIAPHSVVDCEAEERGTSVYLVDRTVPMLPERLCNELCSLRPNEEKLCFSAVFTLNENLDILDEWLGRTIIRSDHRFAYEDAQQVIETGRGPYAEELLTLNRLAQAMRAERFRRGAVAFDRDEMKFRLDEKGRPTGVYFKVQKEANQLIEEFMLLANRRVAEYCAHRLQNGRKVPRTMVFRVHDAPNEEKLERFRSFILRFGHVFKASKGRAVAKEINKLLKKVKGAPEENAVSTMAVRSMAKAFYTTDNIGHYGLAFPCYTHFTSPIRRYPDMMVHRLLARYLDGGKSADRTAYEKLCEHASEREVVAAEAERASIKYKAVEFMADKIGRKFEGHISGLTEWGIYVELEETRIEGVIYLRDIEGDYFQFDAERYEIYGHATGRRFTLGDKLTVQVKQTDLRKRMIHFAPVENSFRR